MSRLSCRSWVLVCLAAAWLVPSGAAAQAVTGTISGTIADAQGGVVPGANVTVTNEATNVARETVTDVRGDFQVTNLHPGSYTVAVEMASFRR
jgi:uncharacterized surface anchored protein